MAIYQYRVTITIGLLNGTRQKVPAIKLIRNSTGLGLKDAKHFVEEHQEQFVTMLLSAAQFGRFISLHKYGQLCEVSTAIRVTDVMEIEVVDRIGIVDMTANGTR